MGRDPKDRTPLFVQAEQREWDSFVQDVESDRANDNSSDAGWRRDFDGEAERIPGPANLKIDTILAGLLTPRPETYAEELRRRAGEQDQELRDRAATPERDNELDLER